MAPRLNSIGLGCMRLSTEPDRDMTRASATLEAALEAGVRVFDTARAYGVDDDDLGHNERLLRGAALPSDACIVTKGGMRRPGGRWRPDGRARSIRGDAEASAEALGRPADVWLLHAPDPRVKLETSLRAMAKVLSDGTALSVGLSNVRREALHRARDIVEVSAVQVELSVFEDTALRGGVLALCHEHGIPVMGHRPLGGPKGSKRIAKDAELTALAAPFNRSPHALLLHWWSRWAVPLAGCRRPETARELAPLELDADTRAQLDRRHPSIRFAETTAPPDDLDGDIVLLMGIPGAGKTTRVTQWTDRGYLRLNRDTRGGSLRKLAEDLGEALGSGTRQVVLDNTYLSRASRADVLRVAWEHGVAVRCVHIDTPPDVARARVCARLLEQFGELPAPETLVKSRVPGVFPPTRHHRMVAELESPEANEGFAQLEVVTLAAVETTAALAHVVARSPDLQGPIDGQPTLCLAVTDGPPPASVVAGCEGAGVDLAVCTHRSGAPRCWCRPPLPGLVVAWLRDVGVPASGLVVHGGGTSFERMARSLGASWIAAPDRV